MQQKIIAALVITLLSISVNAGVQVPADLPDGIYVGDLSPTPNFSLVANISMNATATLAPRTLSEDRHGPPDHNRDTTCGDYEINAKEFDIIARRMTGLATQISASGGFLEDNTIITLKSGVTVIYICVGEQTQPVFQEGPTNYKEWTFAWNNMEGHCGSVTPMAAHFTYHGFKRVWGRANVGVKVCEGVMDKNFMKWDGKTDAPWKKPLPGVDW